MVESRPLEKALPHRILLSGIAIITFPIFIVLVVLVVAILLFRRFFIVGLNELAALEHQDGYDHTMVVTYPWQWLGLSNASLLKV